MNTKIIMIEKSPQDIFPERILDSQDNVLDFRNKLQSSIISCKYPKPEIQNNYILFNSLRTSYHGFNMIRFWKCELWRLFTHHIFCCAY